jgi:hypothetical protein
LPAAGRNVQLKDERSLASFTAAEVVGARQIKSLPFPRGFSPPKDRTSFGLILYDMTVGSVAMDRHRKQTRRQVVLFRPVYPRRLAAEVGV